MDAFSRLLMVIALSMWAGMYWSGALCGDSKQSAKEAIQQCEAELPRHQKCKAVITAEVIENE
jgi:hypothetical protein